ncbi:MAG: TRAP transporter substrate-binding protein [Acidobacteriota bacterium]|nr:TRAP transporter substrate-binding protein [Acidobacteriota bacterium]
MERRKFIAQVGAGAALGMTAACGSSQTNVEGAPAVQTAPRVNWRLASSFPRSLDTIYGAAETLAKRVEELTEGRFTIRVYPGGEMVPALQVLDAVQKGTVQIGHTAGYYYKGKHPALSFDCSIPFGMTARQQIAWIYQGGGLEKMRKVFAQFNMINLPGGNTGCQMGGWFRKELNSLADVRALKMRIPGLGGEVMSEMGATVQVLGGGDIYPALERGAIDATEWVGPYDDEKLGFYKVAKNYYYPGWWEPGPSLSFLINQGAWDKLPKTYQNALSVAAAEADLEMVAKYDAKNPPALTRLLDQGVTLRPFPDDIMTEARKVTRDLMSQLVASNSLYKEVYDHWSKFKEESDRWMATAEFAYSKFMLGG